MVTFFKREKSVTVKDIHQFAHRIKADLSPEYVDILLKHNGSNIDNNIIEISSEQNANLKKLIPIENIENYKNEINDEYVNDFCFPFALDDSGNYFLMDKNGSDIYFYDHEFKGKEAISKISDSFHGFLNKIQPYDIQKQPMPEGKILYVNEDFMNKIKNK